MALPAPPQRERGLRPGRPSRLSIAFAALAFAAILATSALAWGGRLLDFVAGEPAPPSVKQSFALDNEARKKVLPIFRSRSGPAVIAERAHGVLAVETSAGPVVIWAAPTHGGGVCYIIDIEALRRPEGRPNGAGGCSPTPMSPTVKLEHALGITRVGERNLRLVHGRVTPDVAAVELRYANGDSEELPLVEGFFLHEPRQDVEPAVVIARDAAGRELKRRQLHGPSALRLRLQQPTEPYRVLFRIEASAGYPLTFSIARATDGSLCDRIEYRGSEAGGCGPDERARVGRDEISVHPGLWNEAGDGKPLITLKGVVGADVARLELHYENGEVVELPIVERFVLFEIPPSHHNDRRFLLVARNRAGEVVSRHTVS